MVAKPYPYNRSSSTLQLASNAIARKWSMQNWSLKESDLGVTVYIQEPQSTKDTGWKYLVGHFVFDPFSSIYYFWLSHIAVALMYNFIVIPARVSFSELEEGSFFSIWIFLDILADGLYVLDVFASFRISFWQRGIQVTDTTKLSKKYFKTIAFYFDLFSIIPTQIVYVFTTRNTALLARFCKFCKVHRLVKWHERTECRTSFPTLWRGVTLLTIMLLLIHWNACLYFYISTNVITQDPRTNHYRSRFLYPIETDINGAKNKYGNTAMKYAMTIYWSTQTMTTISAVNPPEEFWEYIYLTIILLVGFLIFASIVGSIGNILANVRANRNVFQAKVDSLKEYMGYRKVDKEFKKRIIRWFDFLWGQNRAFENEDVLKYLPDELQTLLALDVHLKTLQKVELFHDCEFGFLTQLVKKLKHQVVSPGDYVCRKGDIGREMYIVKQGLLYVSTDDGQLLDALTSGSYFGEISLINAGENNNRRTAHVRSVGVSDLFSLKKEDLLNVLNDYPEMKEVLKSRANKRLALNECAERKRLARNGYPQQSKKIQEHEEKVTITDTIEQTDTWNLRQKLEDLEKVVLVLTKETKKINKRVVRLQKQLAKCTQAITPAVTVTHVT